VNTDPLLFAIAASGYERKQYSRHYQVGDYVVAMNKQYRPYNAAVRVASPSEIQGCPL
jgi:hypothetical protein